jgi:hypothetical protein
MRARIHMQIKGVLWRLRIFLLHTIQRVLALREITIVYRKVRFENLNYTSARTSYDLDKTCIVMQGPILTRGSLTLKSLSAYRNLYPNTPMVLSTWRKEVDEIHDELKNLDIDIIETERPAYPGYGNINLQITSAINGINHSLKYNPKFLLKTRTDIFLSSPNFLETLIEHSWFGSKDNALVNRLIITSFNSFIFRPFSFNDQLTFGKTSDVVRFWSAPNDYRLESEMLGAYSKNLIEQSRARCAEVWLVTNYLHASDEL